MAFCERNPAQGTMWHVKNSIFALFSFFFFSCFHCVSWIMPIEYCFLCWLFLLSIVFFFSLYPKKVVIQNSERHAEHIAACGLDAAPVSSSV